MDIKHILTTLEKFLLDEYDVNVYIMYGSFAEYRYGLFTEPKDIDINVFGMNGCTEPFEVHIPGIPIPVSITPMTFSDFDREIDAFEPKYFVYWNHSLETSQYIRNRLYQMHYDTKPEHIRKCVSSFSSKAYNKGKKKLIVKDDYDEYLGLKNLYHAFKFARLAIDTFGSNKPFDISFALMNKHRLMWDLKDTYDLIFDTYHNSTGTLEERFKHLDNIIKPRYNALMTEFRKYFPKGN